MLSFHFAGRPKFALPGLNHLQSLPQRVAPRTVPSGEPWPGVSGTCAPSHGPPSSGGSIGAMNRRMWVSGLFLTRCLALAGQAGAQEVAWRPAVPAGDAAARALAGPARGGLFGGAPPIATRGIHHAARQRRHCGRLQPGLAAEARSACLACRVGRPGGGRAACRGPNAAQPRRKRATSRWIGRQSPPSTRANRSRSRPGPDPRQPRAPPCPGDPGGSAGDAR